MALQKIHDAEGVDEFQPRELLQPGAQIRELLRSSTGFGRNVVLSMQSLCLCASGGSIFQAIMNHGDSEVAQRRELFVQNRSSLERVKNGANSEPLAKFVQRKRKTSMKLHCRFSSGRQIEKVVGKESVVFVYGEINRFREFVGR